MINYDFLKGVRVLGIVCTQWGDTGKGKFVDYFADWADVIARGTGGANAGHTIWVNGEKHVFHLLPSAMLHDKLNVIGSGVALEPGLVLDELTTLDCGGVSTDNLRIAFNARLVLPQHVVLDRVRDASSEEDKIGTTGRGMGPAYADHVARLGLTVNDLLNPDVFRKKLQRNLREKRKVLRTYDPEAVKRVMHQEILKSGSFYSDPESIFNEDAIIERYMEYGRHLEDYICDADAIVRSCFREKRNILLEGAQGNMLSVDYGTHPYVTSSDCSIAGLAKGVGLHEHDVDLTLGIVKGFYMTRVGEGPFPTELGGERSAEACRVQTRDTEAKKYPDASINDPDEFIRGVAIRKLGDEYGATTGRPRRTGWLDLPLIRYSTEQLAGPNVILTKIDVLDTAETIMVCTEYEYVGPPYRRGKDVFSAGRRILTAIPDLEILRYCRPIYEKFPGWLTSTREARSFHDIPDPLRNLIWFLKGQTEVNVTMLSVGPDREDTVFVAEPQKRHI